MLIHDFVLHQCKCMGANKVNNPSRAEPTKKRKTFVVTGNNGKTDLSRYAPKKATHMKVEKSRSLIALYDTLEGK